MGQASVSTRKPPSLALCIVVPLFVLLVGVTLSGMFAAKSWPELIRESGRGLIPPGFEVDLPEVGSYTVWIYSYAQHEGTGYEAGEGVPSGAQLLLRGSDGRTIDLNNLVTSTKEIHGESAVAAGTFEISEPDQVSLVASGFPRETVVSIAPVKMGQLFRFAINVGGILIGTFLLSIISLFILLHRRKAVIDSL